VPVYREMERHMGIPWGYVALVYITMLATTIALHMQYGLSATSGVIIFGIASCLLAGIIVARRLVPPRVRFWLISVMAAVFTIATIVRIIVQLLRP
jgi:hypothetical protein